MAGERKDEGPRGDAEAPLAHDADADREYTTPERVAELERASAPGAPAPAPGEDVRRDAVERHGATGARGPDLDLARELAGRDLEEEAAVRREGDADGAAPPRE